MKKKSRKYQQPDPVVMIRNQVENQILKGCKNMYNLNRKALHVRLYFVVKFTLLMSVIVEEITLRKMGNWL